MPPHRQAQLPPTPFSPSPTSSALIPAVSTVAIPGFVWTRAESAELRAASPVIPAGRGVLVYRPGEKCSQGRGKGCQVSFWTPTKYDLCPCTASQKWPPLPPHVHTKVSARVSRDNTPSFPRTRKWDAGDAAVPRDPLPGARVLPLLVWHEDCLDDVPIQRAFIEDGHRRLGVFRGRIPDVHPRRHGILRRWEAGVLGGGGAGSVLGIGKNPAHPLQGSPDDKGDHPRPPSRSSPPQVHCPRPGSCRPCRVHIYNETPIQTPAIQ